MRTALIDTNVILRLLVGDNKPQQEQAFEWLDQARRGERVIVLSTVVVAESIFVLESFYKKDRIEIARIMKDFLTNPWLHVPDRDVLLGIWSLYLSGLHFVDSFLLSQRKEKSMEILSFDKQLLSKI